VVHICNPRLRKQKQEDHEFQANMGYIARPCLKINKIELIIIAYLVGLF
jgi:hypothetical protein